MFEIVNVVYNKFWKLFSGLCLGSRIDCLYKWDINIFGK